MSSCEGAPPRSTKPTAPSEGGRGIALPRWAGSYVVLIGAYLVVMIAAALWLPHEWDWAVWSDLGASRPPVFDAREIAIVDVPWDTEDIAADRQRVAAFLDELEARKAHPAAVVLDIQFVPCERCGAVRDHAKRALISAIHGVSGVVPVFARDGLTLRSGDEADGIDAHDPDIYAALTGAAHTEFTKLGGSDSLFYRVCYTVPLRDDAGNVQGTEAVWDMVERVAMRPAVFATAACDDAHVAVRLPPDALVQTRVATVSLDAGGRYPATTTFDGKYLVVGTLAHDRAPDLDVRGPEVLAWALSEGLDTASAAGAERAYDTEPQGNLLLVLVPAFSAIALVTYVAVFFFLRGRRLQRLRPALPWIAGAVTVVVGLALFAGFEAWMLGAGHVQPQITLIVLGVLITPALCSVRAFQSLFDERYNIEAPPAETDDYDVFVSYAHDEGAWVFEHVYLPLRDARLPDGRALRVFFDRDSIRYGAAWQERIALAIDGSRFIVPVYSDVYFGRPYCKFEIMRAHLKWINAGYDSRCVLPIARGTPKVPAAVSDIQAANIDEVPDLVEQIVREIVGRLTVPA